MSLDGHGRTKPFPVEFDQGLVADAATLTSWMRQAALPVWCTLGQTAAGAFEERLGQDGRRISEPRRARVQARQLYVFAEAGRCGWCGPWRPAVEAGLGQLRNAWLRSDGLMRTRLSCDGETLDETAYVYDQAFLLLALASVSHAFGSAAFEADAVAVRDWLWATADIHGGIREAGDHPHQSNAHMHLLEASLAWEEAGGCPGWRLLSDKIVSLARNRFIDPDGGFIREFFDANWSPARGKDGRLVEPGHQFEWSWLLARYAHARADEDALNDAWRLYAYGLKGVDAKRFVAVDQMNDDGRIRRPHSRLWPQTEWLKASMVLASLCDDDRRRTYLDQAGRALRAVLGYLTPQGLWRDNGLETGGFIDEPAPASSLYHIMASYLQTRETLRGEGDLFVRAFELE